MSKIINSQKRNKNTVYVKNLFMNSQGDYEIFWGHSIP